MHRRVDEIPVLSLRALTQHLSLCHVAEHIVNSGNTEVKKAMEEFVNN